MTAHSAVPDSRFASRPDSRFTPRLILGLISLAFGIISSFPAYLAAQAAPQSAPQAAPQAPAAAPQAAAPAPNPAPNLKDIVDTWQGTLHAGQDLRTVLKITKDEKGIYKGVFYSLDQGAQPLAVDSVSFDGSTVKYTQ